MKKFIYCCGIFMCFVFSSCGGSGGGAIGLVGIESGFGSISTSVYTIQITPSSGDYLVGTPINFSIVITKDGSIFEYDPEEVVISTFKDVDIGNISYMSNVGGGTRLIGFGKEYSGRYDPDFYFRIESGSGTFGFTATYRGVSTKATYDIY